MSNNDVKPHKAIEWAQSEYTAEPIYWQERATNGSGLIKQIADFVLSHRRGDHE